MADIPMRNNAFFLVLLTAVILNLMLLPPSAVRAQTESEPGLLITEVYYDAVGADDQGEWVELANFTADTVLLEDFKIGDEEQLGGQEGMLRFPAGAQIGPGEVIVIAQSATGFFNLYGRLPDYEVIDSNPNVPDMEPYVVWASGSFALNNDGDEVVLVGPDNVILDAVNYGDSRAFFVPSVAGVVTGQSIERFPARCDSDSAVEWQPATVPSPGVVVTEGECPEPPDPTAGLELVAISDIQGSGVRTPLINQIVSFRGIVTGSYEDRNTQGITFYTLFVQAAEEVADGDPATSDAVPVFLGRTRPRFKIGDEVLVTGQVTEFFGMTEISDKDLQIQRLSAGNELPEPALLPLEATREELEAFEGMRVSLPAARVIGPTFSSCSFIVTGDGEEWQRPIRERAEDEVQGVIPVLHTSDVDCSGFPQVKSGDRVQGLEGPLIYHFDEFKIVQQRPQDLVITEAPMPPVPEPPVLEEGQFSVATFNVHDHFDAIDEPENDAEPVFAAEVVARKQAKLSLVIGEALGCPTLLGIQEVENKALLEELAQALEPACGFRYLVAHEESVDIRGIDLGLLADPNRVQIESVRGRQACGQVARAEADGNSCPNPGSNLFSRPPLVVELVIDGQPLTVIVNHFKSKREGEAETAARRLAQAQFVRSLVEERLAQNPDADVLVMGDFNDYPLSRPMEILAGSEGPLFNSMLLAPREERYTYIFSGYSQLLDTILLSPSFEGRLVHAGIMHINADFPVAMAADPDSPYHASDHDIPFLILKQREPEPVIAEPTLAPTTTAEPVPTIETAPTPEAGELSSLPWPGMGAAILLVGAIAFWLGRRGR